MKSREIAHLKPISKNFQAARVAILGRPNAGKSTLLNALLGSALSATSSRPQTTTRTISGVLQRFSKKKWTGQVVLMDTPGLNLQRASQDRSLFTAIEESLSQAQVIVWLADARSFEKDLLDIEMGKIQEDRVANWLQETMRESAFTWILALNKVDLIDKGELLPLIERSLKVFPQFKEVIPVSAALGLGKAESNLEDLLSTLERYSVPASPIYSQDELTDISRKDLIREFIREAIFRGTQKEVPYKTDCQILRFQEAGVAGPKAEIDAVILTSRPSLKAILVGAKGQKIKEIGMSARKRFEEVTGEEIILRATVKVVGRWEQKPDYLENREL